MARMPDQVQEFNSRRKIRNLVVIFKDNYTTMIDLLICSVPAGIINRPPAAPALLKACVVDAGYTANTLDLSLMLYTKYCNSNYESYDTINRYFEPLVCWQHNTIVDSWLNECVDMIAEIDPKFVAISVFSIYQHRATLLLCEQIRKKLPEIKIILGGYGLPETCDKTFKNFRSISSLEKITSFGNYLTSHDLTDYCVYGEGEQQLVDIVAGQPQTSNIVELEHVPFSNFDDYDLDHYLWHNEPVLMVTGSKGCVRRCTFCNVPQKFGRYRRKSGQRIAEEMIHLSQQYNICKFVIL